MKKILLGIRSNEGYTAGQVRGITLSDLKDFVDELIEYYDEDTEVVTYDLNNRYGAMYGKLLLQEIENEYEEDEEEENV